MIPPPVPAPRFQHIDRQQMLLRPVDVDGLVDADHPARNIWDFLGQLDLSLFTADIRSVEGHAGRAPWPPRLLIAIWIYSYSRGFHSAREIERQCAHEPGLGWLTGLQKVNHHTLSDFRTQYGEALRELFVEVLGILKRKQLITLDRVMQDGTKVRADTNKKSFATADAITEAIGEARQHVAELEAAEQVAAQGRKGAAKRRRAREREQKLNEALEEVHRLQREKRWEKNKQCQASRTDPESHFMRDSNGGLAPSYNVQLVTDAAQGLVLGVEVSTRPTDELELAPAMDQLAADLGAKPRQVVVDAGYTSAETVVRMADRGIDLIGSWPKEGSLQPGYGIDPAYAAKSFTYDAENNEMICPEGRSLPYQSTQKSEEWAETLVFAAAREDCSACPRRSLCRPKNKMKNHGRSVSIRISDDRVIAFKEKMQTEDAKQIYKQRAPVAEFPNAWIKTKLKFTRFHCRGRTKALAEATWAALTFNLQRLFKLAPDCRDVPAAS